MGDVILFSCGGAARHILGKMSESPGVPVVMLDSNGDSSIPLRDEDVPDIYLDEFESYTMAVENRDEIRARMHGMRVVIMFSVLGGWSSSGILPVIAKCARAEGCSVVTVAGLPFEASRRDKGLRMMNEVLEMSDRMFVVDMAAYSRIYPDLVVHRVMNLIASSVSFSVRNLAHLMEGPFFSTFYKKVYTVAYTTDMSPSNAVARAADASAFEVDPAYGKSIIMVSSGFGTAQIESIYNTVVSMTGIIPDIVKREDADDTRVLTFIPVQGF